MFAPFSLERLRLFWERFWQGFGNPLDLKAFLSVILIPFKSLTIFALVINRG